MKTEILGIGFHGYTLTGAVEWALDAMRARTGAYVCTPNPEMVWAAQKNGALKRAINGADAVFADGVGILWAANRLKEPLPERVAGYDFLLALLARMEGTVFLLGGRPGVAEAAGANIEKHYPRVKVVGCAHGYFTGDEDITGAIRAAGPDFLAVCLGSPGQELWMEKQARAGLPVGLMAGLGGSLDVLAGRVKRAPDWWVRHRLEWLYRLLREPSRIKRQICLPRFMLAVMAQRKKHEW